MAHDGPHHGYAHDHGDARDHGRPPPPRGHNGGPGAAHLHSHPGPAGGAGGPAEAVATLSAQFVEGFVAASDKAAFLRLAGVPTEIGGADGAPSLKLVDVRLVTEWQVGTASPAFGSEELSYLPYPGSMIAGRTDLALVYVSLRERREVDLREHLAQRLAQPPGGTT